MRWRRLVLVVILAMVTACAPVISPEIRASVDRHLTYRDISSEPAAYIGKLVILAGTIIEARNLPQGTRLEILQFPATRRGRPQSDRPSGGRFLIMSPHYLETAVYRPGRAITVAGRITKVQALALDETVYHYPLLEPQELHLWKEGGGFSQLRIGFGFGFSTSF